MSVCPGPCCRPRKRARTNPRSNEYGYWQIIIGAQLHADDGTIQHAWLKRKSGQPMRTATSVPVSGMICISPRAAVEERTNPLEETLLPRQQKERIKAVKLCGRFDQLAEIQSITDMIEIIGHLQRLRVFIQPRQSQHLTRGGDARTVEAQVKQIIGKAERVCRVCANSVANSSNSMRALL